MAVSSASGIFPDGLLFDIPEADQPPPSKALAELFEPGTKSLDMYLTVPDYRQRGVNVAAGPEGGSRYVAQDDCSATKIPAATTNRFEWPGRTCT